MRRLTITAAILLTVGLPLAARAEMPPGAFDTLVEWMTGSFSSTAQAAADSNYYDIRLEMVRIWPERTDGCWIYVEQAVAASLDKPYRQRVYHVVQLEDDLFKSEVYTLPDPQSVAGQWQDPALLADLGPTDLEERDGCAVFLRQDKGGEFAGGTIGRGCGSGLRGAAYATSEVVIGPDRLASWDRGFGAGGAQVWGAERGPYIFEKKND